MRLILALILLCGSAWADVHESTIEYKNGKIHFTAIKTQDKITFIDDLGPRSLDIRKCNQKEVNGFWNRAVHKIQNLHARKENKKKPLPWVKYDGIKISFFNFFGSTKFFNGMPKEATAIFVESERLCLKK